MLYYIKFDELKKRTKKAGNGPSSRYLWAFYDKYRGGWNWSLCIKEGYGRLPGEYHYWGETWVDKLAT